MDLAIFCPGHHLHHIVHVPLNWSDTVPSNCDHGSCHQLCLVDVEELMGQHARAKNTETADICKK